jgi:haloalkane dehalogenase
MRDEAAAPPREGVLRTPESRFAGIRDYPWPPAYFEVEPGLRMAWVDTGPRDAAETVVLLHGEPTWGYLYRKMIAPLQAAGLRVVVPDLIGFGRSDKPTDPEAYTYSGHVAWVTRLVEHLDLENATLFGQDWGGLIGARVVAENEQRFARVVFSNTALPGRGMPALPGLRAQEWLAPERLHALLGIDWRSTVDDDDRIDPDRVHALVHPDPAFYFPAWRVYSQEVEAIVPSKIVPGWCLEPVSAEACAAYDAPFPTEAHATGARRFPLLVPITEDDPERDRCEAAWEVFRRWHKPALTLFGDHCPHTNADLGRAFQTRIPGARLPGIGHEVLRASHFIQEDMGETLAAKIVAFVQRFPLGASPEAGAEDA